MKKNLLTALLAILFLSPTLWAQITATTTTEYFETVSATSFTNTASGLTFLLTNDFKANNLTNAGVDANTPASVTGHTSNFVDNSTSPVANQINSIKATNGQFKAIEIYIYPSSITTADNPTTSGTIIVKGKVAGTAVVTTTLTSTTFTNTNYLGNYSGFNYAPLPTFTATAIDELEFTLTGAFVYIAVDNFRFTSVLPTTPLSATQSQTNLACNGVCTGIASVVAAGGVAPYTYAWSPAGGSGATASSLCAANYTCTITDAASTTTTKVFSITQPSAIVTSPVSQTNVACNGGTNGAAAISASGGTGTLTYNWNPGTPTGDGTNSVTGLASGTWSCTITDANSCTHTSSSFNITQPTALVVSSVSQTNISCFGGVNGAASASPSGGAGGFTYNWTPGNPTGDGTASVTGLAAGNWTCTVTDANACSGTKVFAVTQPSAAVSGTSVVTNVACFGGTNGSINLTPAGGAGGYTYSWNGGVTTEDRTGLAAGTYSVVITDANACTGTMSATVTQPTAISTSTAVTNVLCNGGNGSATVTASGGAGGFTYSWAPSGGTGAAASSLAAGNYTCTISDANGCSATKVATITQPSAISTSTAVTNVLCNGGNGSATVTASGGAGGFTYSWAPSGGTGTSASSLAAGNYTCTITDANACSATKVATITQPSTLTTSTAVTNVLCNGGNGSATVTASGGTGGFTYSWAPSGGTGATASSLAAGNYTCTITDANACTTTKVATITQPSAISTSTAVTNVLCNGGNGSATVTASGGTGTLTYSWSPSGGTGATASSLAAGNYTCTITDANACTVTKIAAITQPSAISTSTAVTNVLCNGGNGSATVTASGGTGTLTYSWSPSGGTSNVASGLAAGSYTCKVTDANACTTTKVATITQPSAISTSTAVTNVLCNGGTGSATVTASGGAGGFTYSWAPSGGTGATASSLAAGNYTCTISDANGCSATKVATITQPSAISASTAVTNVLCNGGTGSATVTASGGTGTLTYSWSPSGGTGATASSLAAGSYTCTITDANACTTTKAATITQPTSISASTSVTNVLCNGGTGSATVTASGGAGGFTYSWAPSGGTGATATGLAAGNYTCTITDANACITTKVVAVSQPTALVASSTSGSILCNGGSTNVTVTETGGTSPYTGDGVMTNVTAGTYSYMVSDANGCQSTTTITVSQPTALVASSISGTIACNTGSTSVTVSETGGTSPYTGDGVMSNITAGSYSYTVTDNNGCASTTTITVSEPTALVASSTSGTIACNTGSTSVTVSETGGTSPYTGDGVMSNITAGTYSYMVSDANGCQSTTTITVSQPTALIASSTSGTIACNGGVTAVTVAETGGTSPYTGDGLMSNITAGTYSYMVSDANGCQSTTTITVTQPDLLVASFTSGTILCNGGVTNVTPSTTGGTNPLAISGDALTNLTAGSYSYTVTDGNGCVVTTTVTITQPNAIDASVTSVGGTITANDAAATYQWVDCNNANAPIVGETNQSFTPVSSGNYAVIVTEGACSATSTCTPITTSGIANNKVANSISVYPNPFSNELTINSPTKTNAVLYDMLGNKITEFVLQNTTQTIHVGDLNPGVYYLQIDTQKIKIIKQ